MVPLILQRTLMQPLPWKNGFKYKQHSSMFTIAKLSQGLQNQISLNTNFVESKLHSISNHYALMQVVLFAIAACGRNKTSWQRQSGFLEVAKTFAHLPLLQNLHKYRLIVFFICSLYKARRQAVTLKALRLFGVVKANTCKGWQGKLKYSTTI